MKDRIDTLLENFMTPIVARHRGDVEFIQAVEEVAQDVLTIEKASAEFTGARVLERLCEADRIIDFRITWRDDAGEVQINRGWRVQHTNLLGPYKGGLRWSPTVDLSVLKFLAFEQAFKNALTGLPLGAAKGGADFNTAGRSEAEVERFAAAFMAELAAHIGPDRDVPAGDIGVGDREIGYLFRAWVQHARRWGGAMTGKPLSLGGSPMRAQATGFGLVHFTQAILAENGEELSDKRIAISGRGNVARFAAKKAIHLGARVISLSGRAGTWHAKDGFTVEALEWVVAASGKSAKSPPAGLGLEFLQDNRPWGLEPDIALPCATQNEVEEEDAKALADGGCRYLAEGANMPVTAKAEAHLRRAGVIQAPGKAANAGGVAVSGLEMQQNATYARWSEARLDAALRDIMCDIHGRLKEERANCCTPSGAIDYRRAANVAGYRKLARAVIAGGVI
ncbi:NADP-specific glutamate dehydrogenase [Pararhodobacter sp. SW119]|uniref:NADP-specific glutamate dehydrogenase n=1 Tax=Pararhodobacter sp. SW119 TaxID=2780075 RepID=UPI001AE02E18|nr:NADP-specific glutamate dehydrogenase [Pararhodobacter sp. SW119]